MPGSAGSAFLFSPAHASAISIRTETGSSRLSGTGAVYLYLLVVSGALFPLRFVPINYEWLTLAATVGIGLYQLRRFGPGELSHYRTVFLLLALIVIYQSAKALVTPEQINPTQFLRALYGQVVFGFALILMVTSPLPRERILDAASDVLLLLTVLVLLSVATGFRFYATGFLPEAEGGDIRDVISSGNYRIITYYSAFTVFLLFANLLLFFRTRRVRPAIVAIAALVLIVLTGTRSLIAPSIVVAALIMLRYARPATSITFLVAIGLLSALVYAALPDLVDSYVSRFYVGEVFDAWRALEQELTIQAIKTAPIFGLPMGAPYTHVMSALAGGTEGYTVNADYDLHNEYLWLMLYFGTVGCALLATLVVIVSLSVHRRSTNGIFAIAFFAYLLVMAASMNYSGILLKGYGALLFGLAAGLCTRTSTALPPGLPRPGSASRHGFLPA